MKKKILSAIILLAALSQVQAQDGSHSKKSATNIDGKNMVELNVLALPLKNFSVNYHRQIARKITVGITLRAMPNGALPFEKSFRKAIKDSTAKRQLDNFKVSSYAFIPEIRFYLGKKGAFHGFYIALFGNIGHYSVRLPYSYSDNGADETLQMTGNINTITGGFMLGTQWNLSKSFYIDLHFIGPNVGSASGSISGNGSLSSSEQTSLKKSLDDINIPFVKTSNTVTPNGATLKLSGPWVGIRSGVCIGFRF